MPYAAVAVAYGGPEHIELIDIPSRAPGAGEVRIEVRASGVNPVDAKIMSGARGDDPAVLPLRLGFELAGVVAEVGPAAEGQPVLGADGAPLRVGDEVLAFRVPGAHASEVTVPAGDVLHKPASASFESAAGLLLAGATAAHALHVIELLGDETVLVHGAAGSVGRATVQLARRMGARVIGTAAARHHEALRALGAEPLVYGAGLAERVRALGGSVDAAVDTVGTAEALAVSLELVDDPHRIVTIANGPAVEAAGGQAIGGAMGTAYRDGIRAELVRLLGAGELEIPVVRTFPLREIRAAFEFVLDGHAGGKVVLIP
ncbi:MAG: NADP-dependent oxidoreductase [Microbacteriaceae bacterium]|nr:NADP-dependent oxidoreductase [Microbacteriaceae bacterium]